MEGKLIKRDDDYKLFVNDATFAQSKKSPYKKLSLKNCKAIENGYDLDELVKERFGETFWHDGDKHFKEGFQKALEILGDKKFSEEDMRKMYDISCGKIGLSLAHDQTENNERFLSHLRSIQQTEWDVIIEMEPYHDGDFINDGKTHIIEAKLRYRLDSDGCLILKRK